MWISGNGEVLESLLQTVDEHLFGVQIETTSEAVQWVFEKERRVSSPVPSCLICFFRGEGF